MKLKKMLIATALLSGVAMVGCESKNETEQTIAKDINIKDIEEGLLNSGLFDEYNESNPAKDHWIFESVKDKIEDGFMIQAMMNVKLEDVFVIKTTDVDAVEQAIIDYKENNFRLFADGYGGDENATAVANSKLEKIGDYVYFIATPNASEVESKLLELMK